MKLFVILLLVLVLLSNVSNHKYGSNTITVFQDTKDVSFEPFFGRVSNLSQARYICRLIRDDVIKHKMGIRGEN